MLASYKSHKAKRKAAEADAAKWRALAVAGLHLNIASRSFSNEANGREMFASVSNDAGVVLFYIPKGATADQVCHVFAV